VLVVADLVLALVLLAGAGLMLRTVAALTHANPGFNPSRMLTLQFSLVGKAYAEDAAVIVFQDRTLEKLRAIPGVTGAVLAGQIPFGGNADCWGFHAKGRMKPNPVDDPCVERYGITPDYLRVMDIPVLGGRGFNETDTATGQPVIVISQSTAKAVWGTDNPIGSQVRIGNAERGDWRTVIGVVADVHHDDLTAPLAPAMYVSQAQFTDSYLVAVVKSAATDAASLAAPSRRACASSIRRSGSAATLASLSRSRRAAAVRDAPAWRLRHRRGPARGDRALRVVSRRRAQRRGRWVSAWRSARSGATCCASSCRAGCRSWRSASREDFSSRS
jgi:hypothetical protein